MPEHTDKILQRIRDCMNRWDKADALSGAEARAAFDLVEQFAVLDAALQGGDYLPAAWAPARTPMSELVAELRGEITRQLAEQQRLANELDSYQGRTVYFALDRDLDQLLTTLRADAAVQPGAIARATDTGREYELSRTGNGNGWWKAKGDE